MKRISIYKQPYAFAMIVSDNYRGQDRFNVIDARAYEWKHAYHQFGRRPTCSCGSRILCSSLWRGCPEQLALLEEYRESKKGGKQ